jgi:hypothetical protein
MMAVVSTGFDPEKYAFRFPNRFEFDLAASVRLPLINGINIGDIVYGLCGGMSCAAIDHFLAGVPVTHEEKVENLPTSYILHLWNRQLDSLGGLTVLNVLRWMLRSDAEATRKTSQYELPKLKRRLLRGNPTVLALIRVGGFGNPTLNHQVLAIGFENVGSDRLTKITLYEPNYPRKAVHLTVDRTGKKPVFSQSTGEPLRGFFLIDYQREAPVSFA